MSEKNRVKDYYKNNRDVILNRSKEYYINNEESILEHLKNKYQSLTEDKKQKIKDYHYITVKFHYTKCITGYHNSDKRKLNFFIMRTIYWKLRPHFISRFYHYCQTIINNLY